LQWSTAGWFGSLLGCTLWMVLLAGNVASIDPWYSAALFGLFFLAVGIGVRLYVLRDRIAPMRALQISLVCTFLIGGIFFVCVSQVEGGDQMMKRLSHPLEIPSWSYLIIYPILGVWLTFLDRKGPAKQ
jgi:hypothetical protein